MKNFYLVTSIVIFLLSVIAFSSGDLGYGLGLLSGSGAWLLMSICGLKVKP